MKVYIIQNSGVDHNELLGLYTNKKLAERDMDFIGKNDAYNSRIFQQRWVKVGKCWYRQSRSRYGRGKFPEWESPRKTKRHGVHGMLYVAEYDIREHGLEEITKAIKTWQRRGDVHELTCGHDSKHPALVPQYFNYPVRGVGLKCKTRNCHWTQKPDHPILGLVHASFLRNRT